MTTALVSTGVLVVVALVSMAWELRTGNIPNALTLPSIGVGLFLGAWGGATLEHVLGFVVGAVPAYVAWRRHWAGGGAVKLGAAVGALSGWCFGGSVLLLTAATFLAWWAVMRARGREHGTIPGAPVVAGAVLVVLAASYFVPQLRIP